MTRGILGCFSGAIKIAPIQYGDISQLIVINGRFHGEGVKDIRRRHYLYQIVYKTKYVNIFYEELITNWLNI